LTTDWCHLIYPLNFSLCLFYCAFSRFQLQFWVTLHGGLGIVNVNVSKPLQFNVNATVQNLVTNPRKSHLCLFYLRLACSRFVTMTFCKSSRIWHFFISFNNLGIILTLLPCLTHKYICFPVSINNHLKQLCSPTVFSFKIVNVDIFIVLQFWNFHFFINVLAGIWNWLHHEIKKENYFFMFAFGNSW